MLTDQNHACTTSLAPEFTRNHLVVVCIFQIQLQIEMKLTISESLFPHFSSWNSIMIIKVSVQMWFLFCIIMREMVTSISSSTGTIRDHFPEYNKIFLLLSEMSPQFFLFESFNSDILYVINKIICHNLLIDCLFSSKYVGLTFPPL